MTLTCKGNYSHRCAAVFQNNIVRELKNIEKAFQKRASKAKHKKKNITFTISSPLDCEKK